MCKVLFVYPNKEGYPIIPIAISLLSGILKQDGHKVELFDVTFMVSEKLDNASKEKAGLVQPVDVEAYWGKTDGLDVVGGFKEKIRAFNPDLIAFSIVENHYACARELIRTAKEIRNIPIIVGGIFPTVAPEFFINDENVDLICIGEGEFAIIDVAKKIDDCGNFSGIPNLIVKPATLNIEYNPYYLWDPPIPQDWEIFDDRHLFKPFLGRMPRVGYFEFSRGCLYGCYYCNNHIKQKLFKSLGKYNREKPIELLADEVSSKKSKYNLDLIFFNDENFLQMNEERFKNFCRGYKEIGLPFLVQTRADSLLDEVRIKMLKDAGCVTIAIGVEHGNERFRRDILNKNISNRVYETAFGNCNRVGIRTTANVMIGFPFETEKMILETATFCRKIKAPSVSVAIFAPYHGTELRKICVKNGFLEDIIHDGISVRQGSLLSMPQLSKERISELYYKFQSLVFGDEAKI